jgi:hypothetical protein
MLNDGRRLVDESLKLCEHLGRAARAKVVDPLIAQLKTALVRRFRAQARAYKRTGSIATRQALGFRKTFAETFAALTTKAYRGGAEAVAAKLGGTLAEAKKKPSPAVAAALAAIPLKDYGRSGSDLER